MRAAIYHEFGGPIEVRDVAEPAPGPGEVIVRVLATGICRSDWHGWRGDDPDIRHLPHVPGHEFAGEIAALGEGVTGWRVGDRVTVPFVAGCGECGPCRAGDTQVCEHQSQPGFTHWGTFAEYVRVRYAAGNLVALPEGVDLSGAALLGCRFTTAHRAVVAQGRARPGEWVAVHGCGGVGLSAVMIAASLGCHVAAVDVDGDALRLASEIGAEVLIRADADAATSIADATGGGAHVSVDAIGDRNAIASSIRSLRPRGRHVQVGLVVGHGRVVEIPMDRVIGLELEILGSHGMPARAFGPILQLVVDGRLDPSRLVTRRCGLAEGAALLTEMGHDTTPGVTVIESP